MSLWIRISQLVLTIYKKKSGKSGVCNGLSKNLRHKTNKIFMCKSQSTWACSRVTSLAAAVVAVAAFALPFFF